VLDKTGSDGFSRFERYSVRRPMNPHRCRSAKDWRRGYEHEDPAVVTPPKHIWTDGDRPQTSDAASLPSATARAAAAAPISPRTRVAAAGGSRELGAEASPRPTSSSPAERRKATLRQLTQHEERPHPPPCACAECGKVEADTEGFKAVVGHDRRRNRFVFRPNSSASSRQDDAAQHDAALVAWLHTDGCHVCDGM